MPLSLHSSSDVPIHTYSIWSHVMLQRFDLYKRRGDGWRPIPPLRFPSNGAGLPFPTTSVTGVPLFTLLIWLPVSPRSFYYDEEYLCLIMFLFHRKRRGQLSTDDALHGCAFVRDLRTHRDPLNSSTIPSRSTSSNLDISLRVLDHFRLVVCSFVRADP